MPDVAVADPPKAPESKELTPDQMLDEIKKALTKAAVDQGLKPEQLEAWKAAFGEIAFVPIGKVVYIIRALSRKEWKEATKTWNAVAQGNSGGVSELDREEEIAIKALLHPRPASPIDFKTVYPAGVPSTLAEAVTGLSGFVPNVTPIII
jgi:hypothetical protein